MMKNRFSNWSFSAAAVLLLATGTVSTNADAAFIAYICDDQLCTGGGDTIVTDQGAGDNFPGSAIVGQINSGALSVGGFTIATNVAQTTPYLGSAGTPILDLTFSAVTSDNQSHTIYLYASATGYTGQGPFLLTLGGTQPPPGTGNSITGMAFGGTSNTNLNFANMIASVTSTATPFALSTTGVFAPSLNPYGLTIGVAITRAAPGTTTGDLHFSIGAVPEPDPLSLLGIGIGGLLAATCLRRRAAARA